MKHISLTLLLLLLLAHSFASPVAQRTRANAKVLRYPHTARQLAPYPATGYRPQVPFTLPTDQTAEKPAEAVTSATATQLEEVDAAEADEDLAEDVDPITADAAEDDTELLPEPEARVSGKDDEEQDENADIIPERATGPTPSKRYWFFRK